MKKIEIEEIRDSSGKIYSIRITKQTHRCNDFGENSNIFFYIGFSLSSYSDPEADFSQNNMFVRGSIIINDDREILVDSEERLETIKRTINAYNKHFANCDDCIERNCNTCPANKEK